MHGLRKYLVRKEKLSESESGGANLVVSDPGPSQSTEQPCEVCITPKGISEVVEPLTEEAQSSSEELEHLPEEIPPPAKKRKCLSSSDKKQQYISRLSFRTEWQSKYPWVTCTDSNKGMFCSLCLKWGKPPAGSRGAWTTRGITKWKHATEVLKSHSESQWHKDAAITASMAKQTELGESVLELYNTAAAKEREEKRKRNREILLKLMRSVIS